MYASNDKIFAEETAFRAKLGLFVATLEANSGAILTQAVLAKDNTVDITTVTSAYDASIATKEAAKTALVQAKKIDIEAAATLSDAKTVADTSLNAVLDLCPDFDVADPDAKIKDELV